MSNQQSATPRADKLRTLLAVIDERVLPRFIGGVVDRGPEFGGTTVISSVDDFKAIAQEFREKIAVEEIKGATTAALLESLSIGALLILSGDTTHPTIGVFYAEALEALDRADLDTVGVDDIASRVING